MLLVNVEETGVITGEVASKISHDISYGSVPPVISIEIRPSAAPNSQLTPSEISPLVRSPSIDNTSISPLNTNSIASDSQTPSEITNSYVPLPVSYTHLTLPTILLV